MPRIIRNNRSSLVLFGALASCLDPRPITRAEAVSSVTAACDGRVWIGVRRNNQAGCPTVAPDPSGSWFTLDPFATSTARSRAVEMCMYTWVPGLAASPSLEQLEALALLAGGRASPLAELEESCLETSGMNSGLIEHMIMSDARDAFLTQVDPLNPLPQGPVPSDTVHVALVDSVPDYDGLLETSSSQHVHGRALGMLIRELVCPDPTTCPLELTSLLALGRRDECTTCDAADLGDFLGRPAELALAINLAVEKWRLADPQARLVINVSLGWFDTILPDEPASNLPLDMFAVLNALSEANCYGAMILAAAGNSNDGPLPDGGPLYPGAWEMRTAPSDADCVRDFGISVDKGVRSEGGPLLFSVGGVDGIDRPASSVRPSGRPRLAAPSEHLVEEESYSAGGYFRGILSGSSVATAVASAAAAVGWSYRPELTAKELVDLLYQGGEPLTGQYADYCLDLAGGCDLIHRISICGVVEAACASRALTCSETFDCVRRPAFSDDRPGVSPAVVSYLEAHIDEVPAAPTMIGYAQACQANVTAPVGSTDIPCPNRQFENSVSEPVNHPQPGEAPCRLCALTKVGVTDYKLFVSINYSLPPTTTISNGSIELTYANGSVSFHNVPLGPLQPGAEVFTPMTIDQPGFIKATISFLIDGNGQTYSSRDPLVLEE